MNALDEDCKEGPRPDQQVALVCASKARILRTVGPGGLSKQPAISKQLDLGGILPSWQGKQLLQLVVRIRIRSTPYRGSVIRKTDLSSAPKGSGEKYSYVHGYIL
jgi:hypothetical protein